MINVKHILPVVFKQAGRKGHVLEEVGRTKANKPVVLRINEQYDHVFGFRNEVGTVRCKNCGMEGRVTDIPGHEWPEGEIFNKQCKGMHRLQFTDEA